MKQLPNMCSCKIQHTTRAEARRAALNVFEKKKGRNGTFSVYHCALCGFYHWGNNPPKSRGVKH